MMLGDSSSLLAEMESCLDEEVFDRMDRWKTKEMR